MSAENADFGVPLGKWYTVVRRARLGDYKKLAVALVVGSYADTDGTSVKCGVARLAVDCEMGFSTARRYLAWMREVGLIELVKVGNRKARRSDEYRLTVHPHTETALKALAVDEYRDLVDDMKATNRAGEKGRRLSALTQEPSADIAEDSGREDAPADSSALAYEVSAETTDHESPDEDLSALTSMGERRNGFLRSRMSEPPPLSKRSPPTGGAPPPDPRRRPPPPASATEQRKSPCDPLTPAQDQQGESLPHASARGRPPDRPQLADVIPIETWRAS